MSNGKRVAEHAKTDCGSDCKKFLFLKPTGGEPTKMNKAGWVDICKMYELPLECFRWKPGPPDERWHLRDCSFAMIAERTRELIADRVSMWQPRCEGHVLCEKLDYSHLETDDLVCWVESPSKKLVDRNGISYTAYGPCVVTWTNSGKAIINVVSSSVS